MTAREAKTLFEYIPATGKLSWRVSKGTRGKIGSVAGSIKSGGYRSIKVKGKQYLASRIIWLMNNGSWPNSFIDHINGNVDDNRLENLRDVSNAVNQQNQKRARRDNKSGYLGVCLNGGRWMATIRVDRKKKYIGLFDSPEEAHKAYLDAKRLYHKGCTI